MSKNHHIVTKREREQRKREKARQKAAKKEARKIEKARDDEVLEGDGSSVEASEDDKEDAAVSAARGES